MAGTGLCQPFSYLTAVKNIMLMILQENSACSVGEIATGRLHNL